MPRSQRRSTPTGSTLTAETDDLASSRAADSGSGSRQEPAADYSVERTRTGSVFIASGVGLVVALLMIVFILQNTQRQAFEFLWIDFTLPAGVAVLLAAIAGGLVVASLGFLRVLQLRRETRRHRHEQQPGARHPHDRSEALPTETLPADRP